MIHPDTNWAYGELLTISQQVDPSYDPNTWFREDGLKRQLRTLQQKLPQDNPLFQRYKSVHSFVNQNQGLFSTERGKRGEIGHTATRTAGMTFTSWAYGEVLELSLKVDPSIDKNKLFQPGGLRKQLESIRENVSKQDEAFRKKYDRVHTFVINNPHLFSESIRGTFTSWVYGQVLELSKQVDPSYNPNTWFQRKGLTKQLETIQKKLPKQNPALRDQYEKVRAFVMNNQDLFPTKSAAGHALTRTAERTFTNWVYGEIFALSRQLGFDCNPTVWFQEKGLEEQLEGIEKKLRDKDPALRERYQKVHTFVTNNPSLFSERTPGAFTNWVYDQALEFSRLLGIEVDPPNLLRPGGLQKHLSKISNTLFSKRPDELPEARLRLEKLKKCVEENDHLFPQEEVHAGIIEWIGAKGASLATADAGSLERDRDQARQNLERSGLDPATINSLTTMANRIPEFLLKTLQFYCNHPGLIPPPNLQSQFFTFQSGTWQLNETGSILIKFLSDNPAWITMYLETNLLCAIESLRSSLCNPTEFLQKAFTGTREERAQAITDFIFKNCKLRTPIKGMDALLRRFGGWLTPFIQRKIESALTKFEEPTPTEEAQQSGTEKAPAPQALPPPAPPTIPHEIFFQQFDEFKDLADVLGKTLLDGIPDLVMLREARRQNPTPPKENTVPFVEAMGQVSATLVGQMMRGSTDTVVKARYEARNLQEQGRDRDAKSLLEGAGKLRDFDIRIKQEETRLKSEEQKLTQLISDKKQEADIARQREVVALQQEATELQKKAKQHQEEAINLQVEVIRLQENQRDEEAAARQSMVHRELQEVEETLTRIVNQQKLILQKKHQLSPDSTDYPGKCIRAIFSFVTQALKDPDTCENTVLEGLIEKGPPPKLNESGRAVQAFLTDTNVQYLSRLLEENILLILERLLSQIQTKQAANPEFLLDMISTIVGSIQEVIQQADTAADTPMDMPGNAVQIVSGLLRTTFPDLSEAQKAWIVSAVRLGTGHLEKNFEKIVSGLICSMLARRPPAPTPPTEQPPTQGLLEILKKDISPEKYSKRKELRGKIAALFPGLSYIGNRIAHAASKLFPFGRIPFHTILDAVLTKAPPPEKIAEFLLKVPRPEDRYGGPITVKGIVKEKLTALHDETERELKEACFVKHPLRTIKLAFQLFGLAIGSKIAPSLVSSVIGLKGKGKIIGYIQSIVGGSLRGGTRVIQTVFLPAEEP